MKQSLIKFLFNKHVVVNRISATEFAKYKPRELLNTSLSPNFDSYSSDSLIQFPKDFVIENLKDHPNLMQHYESISPYLITMTLHKKQLSYCLRGNFYKELGILEFLAFDLDGFYKTFIDLQDLIPWKYEDLITMVPTLVPFMDFIDMDLIYKHSEKDQFFVFHKEAVWNAETANLPELDFRKSLDENKWIDKQLKTN